MKENTNKFLAHIAEDGREQTVREHCEGTAERARNCLKSVGLGETAYFAGFNHDDGKNSAAYQSYLLGSVRGEKVRRGDVIHTYQGCRMILERYHHRGDIEMLTSELTAYAVAAHHGLFDCVDDRRKSGFEHRLKSEKTNYGEVIDNTVEALGGWERIDDMFGVASAEVENVFRTVDALTEDDGELCFYFGLLARLITSAVIEGDRSDTRQFMEGSKRPDMPADMRGIWAERLSHLEAKLGELPCETEIDRSRRRISDICRDFAEREPGVCRLNVPTGGGKTLSSLRFALAHAEKHGRRRIIFTAPLLTILDQNSKVIRDYIGDDNLILEHHSNVLRQTDGGGSLDPAELLMENWDAPVIITTLVQLLNTLFDGRTSCVRRFQALCGSVIVIDEVQTVPGNMLTMFNLAVNFLSAVCGATFVLCSATQPALECSDHPLVRVPEEIVPYDEGMWKPFRRTEIKPVNLQLEEIPAFAMDVLEGTDSLLIVCNKKAQAEKLFRQLSDSGIDCFHLSAAMCMAHRRRVLDELERRLKDRGSGEKLVCVSTQVIEAGVDISFGRVIRLMAGMDSVVQSAGRCNRHGEAGGIAPVYMVNCENENLRHLRTIEEGKAATRELLSVFDRDPARFEGSLASDRSIWFYYNKLYSQMKGKYQDYSAAHNNDKLTVYDLLSENNEYADEDCERFGEYCLNQSFKLAGELFTVFDQDTVDAVVPYGDGERLIAELASYGDGAPSDFLKRWLNEVKPFTVSLYRYQVEALNRVGGLYSISGVTVLQPGFYDREWLGFTMGSNEDDFLEV